MTARTLGVAAFGLLVAVSGCGADGPDVYSVTADPAAPTTVRTIPPTTVAAMAGGAADGSAGGAAESLPEPVAPNGEVVRVRALDNTFRVADIEIAAGTEVWWTNNGRNDHNVLPVVAPSDPALDWGIDTEDFTPGDEYRHVFDRPGVYLYYCSIHGTTTAGMVGSVTVLP